MKKFITSIFVIATLLNTCQSQSLYKDDSAVIKLNKDNFQSLVIESDKLWFIEFYAPWCGHCKKLAPTWEKVAEGLKGLVNFGALDMTTDKEVGEPFRVNGFPTLKFFGADKKATPSEYKGGRDDDSLIDFAFKQLEYNTKKKLGKNVKEPQSGPPAKEATKEEKKPEEKKERPPQPKVQHKFSDKNVVVLTKDTFDEQVMKSKDIWFLEFYAPWCGHCKKLEPNWNEFAAKIGG
jgi:protein disulfide-isomerase A6